MDREETVPAVKWLILFVNALFLGMVVSAVTHYDGATVEWAAAALFLWAAVDVVAYRVSRRRPSPTRLSRSI